MGGSTGASQEPTEEERVLAAIAAETWQLYQDHFVPVENEFIDRVEGLRSQEALTDQRGRIGASTQQSFGDAVHSALSQQTATGADPSSGRWQEASGGLNLARSASLAGGFLGAQESLKDQHARGLLDISRMGSGQALSSTQGLGDVATQAAQNAQSDAMAAYNRGAAVADFAGTAGGLALEGYMNRSPEIPKLQTSSTGTPHYQLGVPLNNGQQFDVYA